MIAGHGINPSFRWGGERLLLVDGGEQRTQANAHSAQVGDFVDLDMGVNLILGFQNLAHLVGGDCVHAAAEGDELDEVHIPLGGDVACRGVQAGVIRPLVEHALRLLLHVPREGILRDDSRAEARDQLVDAVVDFGIDMIRGGRPAR